MDKVFIESMMCCVTTIVENANTHFHKLFPFLQLTFVIVHQANIVFKRTVHFHVSFNEAIVINFRLSRLLVLSSMESITFKVSSHK